jgi:hypothetical protein
MRKWVRIRGLHPVSASVFVAWPVQRQYNESASQRLSISLFLLFISSFSVCVATFLCSIVLTPLSADSASSNAHVQMGSMKARDQSHLAECAFVISRERQFQRAYANMVHLGEFRERTFATSWEGYDEAGRGCVASVYALEIDSFYWQHQREWVSLSDVYAHVAEETEVVLETLRWCGAERNRIFGILCPPEPSFGKPHVAPHPLLDLLFVTFSLIIPHRFHCMELHVQFAEGHGNRSCRGSLRCVDGLPSAMW